MRISANAPEEAMNFLLFMYNFSEVFPSPAIIKTLLILGVST